MLLVMVGGKQGEVAGVRGGVFKEILLVGNERS